MKNQFKSGFTLIELLIVVAIIAILAAIAVPNFLEAQTRAKVSRVKSDMRTISIGAESYLVDKGRYMQDQDNDPRSMGGELEAGYRYLTTPIAYITSKLTDPFSKFLDPTNPNNDNIALYYQIASGADLTRPNRPSFAAGVQNVQAYAIFSLGPDENAEFINDDWPYTYNFSSNDPNGIGMTGNIKAIYDPTNGTVSEGDIFRFGGDFNAGDWTIELLPHADWNVRESM